MLSTLRSSSPQVWLCSVGVNEGSSQASRPSGPAEHACIYRPYYHIGHRDLRAQDLVTVLVTVRSSELRDRLVRALCRVFVVVSHVPPFPRALGGRRTVVPYPTTFNSQTGVGLGPLKHEK